MTSNVQAIVALCAGAGFLIVWLAFPSKSKPLNETEDTASTAGDSSSSFEKEPPFESAGQEPPKSQSSHSGIRPRWCDILLVEPNASPDAIRKAYARLMKGLHPDVAGANDQTSRQCALVKEAYQQAMYDRRTSA